MPIHSVQTYNPTPSSTIRAAFFTSCILLAGFVSGSSAAEPAEFSTGYLDGKVFFGVSYDHNGVYPLGAYSISFTSSTFAFEDLVPVDATGTGPYTIENGDILIEGDGRVTLLASTEQYLRVELTEPGEEAEISHWYFSEADAEAELATVPLLSSASMNIDGSFSDWEGVPVIAADNKSSTVIDIQSVRYASDGTYVYFMVETDKDLHDLLPSQESNGWTRVLLVEFNQKFEFGTADGSSAWFTVWDGNEYVSHDFHSVGGDFRMSGPRLEGRIPLHLVLGTPPEYMLIEASFGADDPLGADETEDDYSYDEIERLFRLDSGILDGGVEFFGVAKFAYYTQTDSSSPQRSTEWPFEADAFLEASAAYSVVGAEFEAPDASVYTLDRDHPSDTWWGASAEFPDQASMDAAFPSGTYTLSIEMAGGEVKTAPLNLTGDVYPTPPRLSNYEAVQSADATGTFSLSWDAFAGAGPEDFIVVGIEDPVADETVFESRFLPPGSTSLEIPAATLQPGRGYEVWIFFANVVDTNTEAFSEVSGLGIYASETLVEMQTVDKAPAAGEWTLGEYRVADYWEMSDTAAFDVVVEDEDWYRIDGPFPLQVSEQGEISGAFAGHLRLRHHGQLLLYDAANPDVPGGYAIMNRSQDVFLSPWPSDITFAVRRAVSAQQSDFAGEWNFAALTAGTELTKIVYDENLDSELTVTGHNSPIAQDGSQSLVDVLRNPAHAQILSIPFDASGNGGGESLLWQGDGSLAFSALNFPLFVNASGDFAFGLGQEEGEQTVVLAMRAPTNADPSWLVGQWRFYRIDIEGLSRQYWNPDTNHFRWVVDDGLQRRALSGERLRGLQVNSSVEGEVVTVTEALAQELGITPNGQISDDGATWFLNASGDLLMTIWRNGNEWEMEVGVKVSDGEHPLRTLTAQTDGPGGVHLYPMPGDGESDTGAYLQGEVVVLEAENWGGSTFAGWSGDVPAGQEQAGVLVLPMDRDRSVTAHFGEEPWEPEPWDPLADSDGDGTPDVIEQLFATRDSGQAESTPLFDYENTPGGAIFSFLVHEEYSWPWRLAYSHDLAIGSWMEVPQEYLAISRVSDVPPVSEVVVIWPNQDEKVFFRVEIGGCHADEIVVDAGPLTGAIVDDRQHEYFFAGVAGTTYEVILTPLSEQDDPDLLVFESCEQMNAYWEIADASGGEDSSAAVTARLGKSDNPPGQTDAFSFVAPATQNYYILLSGPDNETAGYAIQVTSSAP